MFLIFVTEKITRNNNCLKPFFKKWIFANYLFSISWSEFVSFLSSWQPFFLNNFVCLFIFLWLLTLFFIDFASYYIVRTEEGQPIPKYIYLLYLLYRGLVHRNHRILNLSVLCLTKSCLMFVNVFQISLFQVSMCPFSLFNNFLCLSIFILFVCRCKLSCLFILCCLMSVFFYNPSALYFSCVYFLWLSMSLQG